MSLTKLSKIAWTDGGSYESGKSYEQLTLVLYNGETWLNMLDGNNKAPSDANHWKKVSKAFTFDDFTEEEISMLQKPAKDAADEAKEATKDLEHIKESIIDGVLPNTIVGGAKQLVGDGTASEQTFMQRISPATENAIATINKVKGNSVVWNQLFNPITIPNPMRGFEKVKDGVYSLTPIQDNYISLADTQVIGHKYCISFNVAFANSSVTISNGPWGCPASSQNNKRLTSGINTFLFTAINASRILLDDASAESNAFTISQIQVVDLTQMFGVGNEPTTYAEFLSRKPKVDDEYAFNAGTPINFEAEIRLTGKNLWDEEWEHSTISSEDGETKTASTSILCSTNKIAVIPNSKIYLCNLHNTNGIRAFYYGADKVFISSITESNKTEVTIPSNTYYIRFQLGYAENYAHDICINLSDPSFNGKYEPYNAHFVHCNPKEVKDTRRSLLIFDGTETPSYTNPSLGIYGYGIGLGKLVCDGYTYTTSGTATANQPNMSVSKTGDDARTAYFRNTAYTSVAAWKAYLAERYASGNPVVVECDAEEGDGREHPSFFPYGLCKVGNVYDEFTKTMATKRIGVVKLKDISWSRYSGVFYGNLASKVARLGSYATLPSALKTGKFTTINASSSMTCNNLEIYEYAHNTDSHRIVCKDESCQDVAAFLSAHGEDDLFYELATPIVITYEEMNLSFNSHVGGMEILEGNTAPIVAEFYYGKDYVKLIEQTAESIKNKADKADVYAKNETNTQISNAVKASEEKTDAKVDAIGAKVDVLGKENVSEANLLSSQLTSAPTDNEFVSRVSPAVADGLACVKSIKGNSVVWNQHATLGTTQTINGLTFTKNANGSMSVNGTATANTFSNAAGVPFIKGNKYLKAVSGEESDACYVQGFYNLSTGGGAALEKGNIIVTAPDTADSTILVRLRVSSGTNVSNKTYSALFINLTQMFGSGNEPSTYAEFLARKPKVEDEYAYNAGTPINFVAEKVRLTGKNLWDEDWELGTLSVDGAPATSTNNIRTKDFIEVFGGQTYFIKSPYAAGIGIYQFDANKNYITRGFVNNTTLTLDARTAYIKFRSGDGVTSYTDGICINISDASFNGKYEPYKEYEFNCNPKEVKDAEDNLLFPYGLCKAGSAYDEITPAYAVKRIGVKVLRAAEFIKEYSANRVYVKIDGCKPSTYNCILSNGYQHGSYIEPNKWMISATSTLSIHCTNDAELQALDGVVIVYELATPVILPHDERKMYYPAIKGGTETIVAEGSSAPAIFNEGFPLDLKSLF